MDTYAELRCYFGLTACGNLPEVQFDKLGQDVRDLDLGNRARQMIRNAIDASYEGKKSYRLTIGFDSFVKDETEARTLSDFIRKERLDIELTFTLCDVIHGDLRFYRNLEIIGLKKEIGRGSKS